MTGRAKGSVVATVIALLFLMVYGGTVSGDDGLSWDCPSPARMLFTSGYIDIYPSAYQDGVDPGKDTGARHVYRRCLTSAHRSAALAVVALIIGAAVAVNAQLARREDIVGNVMEDDEDDDDDLGEDDRWDEGDSSWRQGEWRFRSEPETTKFSDIPVATLEPLNLGDCTSCGERPVAFKQRPLCFECNASRLARGEP